MADAATTFAKDSPVCKRTPLYDVHRRLGARMTTFSGFAMPVNYGGGIIVEHRAVRIAAGVFDLSHMGEFEVAGPRALALLERALTNSAARLAVGRAQYSLLCDDDGGTLDDLIVYRLGAERFMLCVNAANIDVDFAWLRDLNRDGAELRDVSNETALVALQGPQAASILAPLADFAIDKLARFGVAECTVAGVRCLAARTGYTGEDGFELFASNDSAERLFGTLLERGAVPVGLGARDTLRLEAALPLYGHEFDRDTTAIEAGLSAYVKFGRGFIGEDALRAEAERGAKKRLIGLMSDDRRSIARQGYRVFRGEREAGIVTSGTFAPTIGRPIALAYVTAGEIAPAAATEGDHLDVEIRNRRVAATVTKLPFYRRAAAKTR
jgi:glycine cleavage system T protein (aminomethyltransferase)